MFDLVAEEVYLTHDSAALLIRFHAAACTSRSAAARWKNYQISLKQRVLFHPATSILFILHCKKVPECIIAGLNGA